MATVAAEGLLRQRIEFNLGKSNIRTKLLLDGKSYSLPEVTNTGTWVRKIGSCWHRRTCSSSSSPLRSGIGKWATRSEEGGSFDKNSIRLGWLIKSCVGDEWNQIHTNGVVHLRMDGEGNYSTGVCYFDEYALLGVRHIVFTGKMTMMMEQDKWHEWRLNFDLINVIGKVSFGRNFGKIG